MIKSPLRYPGGKSRAVKLISASDQKGKELFISNYL
jgi:site-specific DNA-adenine methylase